MNSKKERKEHGFSLVEILIVVVIIGVLAAIAVPNFLKARRSANEASAVSALSLIHRSEMTHKVTAGQGSFTDLAGLYSAHFIDETLGSAPYSKSGYGFEIDIYPPSGSTEAKFDARARPTVHELTNPVQSTGGRDFGVNEAGGIYETSDNTPVTFDGTTREALSPAVFIDR
ncbi:MAG: prepilin-type N-terminal cleavage/methylation domain-containing protein [Pyrinomonadaceae bacterium]